MAATPTLSIVIPLYFEQDNIKPLVERLKSTLDTLATSYEIILVDDGSTDATWSEIRAASQTEPSIVGLKLSRNFGHQHALLAGLSRARGKAIITMDGDLQHPPEVIPTLLDKWREGYEIVNTRREDVEVTGLFKRLSSQIFYRVFSTLTNVPMSKGSSDFRLFDAKVLDELLKFRDHDLFLRGAFQWLGFNTTTVPFKVEKRLSGESTYTLKKMLGFASGAIISFSTKPLIIAIWLGLATAAIAFLELVYILIRYIQGETVAGWASTVGILSFLFGILFVVLGIIGVYLARIHMALQSRPKFVISTEVRSDNQIDN